jgi:hypothetical protein
MHLIKITNNWYMCMLSITSSTSSFIHKIVLYISAFVQRYKPQQFL